MALLIQSSNRVEILQQKLAAELSENPLADVFRAEIIVVPTYAMSRWLNLRFAQQLGIAANIQYPLPASWLWQLAADVLDEIPEFDPLMNEAMAWKIFTCLPDLLNHASFATLKNYLAEDSDDVKRWQLSLRIATSFDRYQFYRPDMIRNWSQQPNDSWQSILWQSIASDLPCHRVEVIGRLIEKLSQSSSPAGLPERVSLFAVSSLPPLFVEVIHAIAQHCPVVLYQHSPTDQYWADLKSRKNISRLRLANSEVNDYFETGNDLLASWGRQGQVLQDLLLEQGSQITVEIDNFQPPENTKILQAIQRSIFDLSNEPIKTHIDESLTVQICHSPLRECQVLHNHLLGLLDNNPDLEPEDILVMVPDISQYAPYIEAVFKTDENRTRPYLNCNLSDLTIADHHPLVLVFLKLLNLPGSRFARSEVLSLLEVEEIRKRFDIDDQALNDIVSTLEDSQLRWGIDGHHKSSLGLPPTEQNTWQQTRQRIFAGYALAETELWNEIAPLEDIDGARALNLGKLWALIERLNYWHQQLAQTTSAVDWQLRLNRLLDDFFVELEDSENQLQSIRETIGDLSIAEETPVSLALLKLWMTNQLANRDVPGQLFSGGITFCGMRPMRSLPFSVICLLGMNDQAFPRRESPLEFDLMAEQWRPGDPLKGDEDRYLMLETLLCAREVLYISYTGRSLKDNSECQPSILVGELLDFIDQHIVIDGCDSVSNVISQQHPMQAFSAQNYLNGTPNYDNYWCKIANAIRQSPTTDVFTTWSSREVGSKLDEDMAIDLGQLRQFLIHPIKYFFNHRFNLRLQQQDELTDEENFELDALDSWAIKQRLVTESLTKGKGSYDALRAEGILPHGESAALCLGRLQNELESFLPMLARFRHIEPVSSSFDLQLKPGLNLSGQVNLYYPGQGLMHFSTASLKGKYVLNTWLDHLALCAAQPKLSDKSSYLICRDQQWRFQPVEVDMALEQLTQYANLYQQGMARPLGIFPNASFAWAMADDPERAIKAASAKWSGVEFQGIPGDKDDEYIQLAIRGTEEDPLIDAEFARFADLVFGAAMKNWIML